MLDYGNVLYNTAVLCSLTDAYFIHNILFFIKKLTGHQTLNKEESSEVRVCLNCSYFIYYEIYFSVIAFNF